MLKKNCFSYLILISSFSRCIQTHILSWFSWAFTFKWMGFTSGQSKSITPRWGWFGALHYHGYTQWEHLCRWIHWVCLGLEWFLRAMGYMFITVQRRYNLSGSRIRCELWKHVSTIEKKKKTFREIKVKLLSYYLKILTTQFKLLSMLKFWDSELKVWLIDKILLISFFSGRNKFT